MNIKNRWAYLCGKLWAYNVDGSYDILSHHYNEDHRHYHTFGHILYCLRLMDGLVEKTSMSSKQSLELELAIWFHDVIYDPRSSDNEQDSVSVFKSVLSSLKTKTFISEEKVSSLILRTKTHVPDNMCQSDYPNYLNDIDLAILGDSDTAFDEYENNIREEYSWVPPEMFAEKRKEILLGFLNRDRIYHTSFFKDRNDIAKNNIQRSLEKLNADEK